jgi:hypothetical protein
MEVEQHYVIKFLADGGMQEVNIVQRLNEHYSHDAQSRSKVYYWLAEVKRGEQTYRILPALEESQMRDWQALLLADTNKTLICQPENQRSP